MIILRGSSSITFLVHVPDDGSLNRDDPIAVATWLTLSRVLCLQSRDREYIRHVRQARQACKLGGEFQRSQTEAWWVMLFMSNVRIWNIFFNKKIYIFYRINIRMKSNIFFYLIYIFICSRNIRILRFTNKLQLFLLTFIYKKRSIKWTELLN